ncbi:MAG: hypothetical protein ACQET5_02955 [Halobacteriota archaeon]|uniref:hypothetical protein n=1 Tax=Natronomonas sp. TaxID=2184060 RepID=UPI00397655D5
MTTNVVHRGDADPGPFPTSLPIEIPYRGRLSWELGTLVVEDLGAGRLGPWRRDGG